MGVKTTFVEGRVFTVLFKVSLETLTHLSRREVSFSKAVERYARGHVIEVKC